MNSSARFIAILLTAVVASCATPKSEKSTYNQGVSAYRAKDFAAARTAWTIAAAGGDHSAESNLGYLLFHGLGGPAEPQRAVALWRTAATSGHSEAQSHLGHAYRQGKGLPQSNAEAYAWFRCSVATAELPGGRSDEAEREIALDARRSLERLLGSLSKEDFERGEALAKQYISAYAKRSET